MREEQEFLLNLSKIITDDNSKVVNIRDILHEIKVFSGGTNIVIEAERRKNGEFYSDKITQDLSQNLNLCLKGKSLIITNITRVFDNKEFFESMCSSLINNVLAFEKLQKEVYIDKLLKISNYTAYFKKLTDQKAYYNCGVAFLDADNLGYINNTEGQEAGDLMLKTVAYTLKKHFRETDIFRRGGDEFILICDNIDKWKFLKKFNAFLEDLKKTKYSACYGLQYIYKTDDINEVINKAIAIEKRSKEIYRKNFPERYPDKYEAKFKVKGR